jgi:hypothetical protein
MPEAQRGLEHELCSQAIQPERSQEQATLDCQIDQMELDYHLRTLHADIHRDVDQVVPASASDLLAALVLCGVGRDLGRVPSRTQPMTSSGLTVRKRYREPCLRACRASWACLSSCICGRACVMP